MMRWHSHWHWPRHWHRHVLPACLLFGAACDSRPGPPTPTVPPTIPVPVSSAAVSNVVPVSVGDAARAVSSGSALPPGPERELTRAHCSICHDENYLVQQRLSPEQWKKTVEKMKTFGAPVPHSDADRIAEYLARSFPVEAPPPPVVWVQKPR